MRRLLTFAIFVAAIIVVAGHDSPAAPPAKAPAAMTADQLPALLKAIEDSAQAWLKEDASRDQELEETLLKVRYDEEIIPALTAAMNTPRPDPINLYVVNRLLEPLDPPSLRADKKPVRRGSVDFHRKLLPTLKTLDLRLVKYQDMPKLGTAGLEAIKMPVAAADEPSETVLRQVEAVQRARDEKIAREKPIALHNQQVGKLRVYLWRLTLACDDPKEDQQLVALVSPLEAAGLDDYKTLVEAMEREAPFMDAERAKTLYDALLKIGEPLRLAKGTYRDASDTPVNPAGYSAAVHDTDADYPGIHIYGLLNKLALIAKAPRVAVPTIQEVNKAIEAANAKPKPTPAPAGKKKAPPPAHP